MAANEDEVEQVRSLADTSPPVDVEEAIDRVGLGIHHWIVFVVVGLVTAADSVEIGFISYVTTCLEGKWDLSSNDKSMMESMIFAGQLVGSPIWGFLADKLGRRPMFLASSFVVSFFGFLTAVAPNKTILIPMRFMVGVGVAGVCVAFDVFCEMLPHNARGKFTMATFYWFTFGTLYTTWVAWLTLENYGWRWFTALAACPTFVAFLVGLWAIPESAHWLVSEGRHKEAAKVVNRTAAMNGVNEKFSELTEPAILEEVETRDLCRRGKLRRPFMSMCLVWMGFGLAYYGIALMVPHMFAHETKSTTALTSTTLLGAIAPMTTEAPSTTKAPTSGDLCRAHTVDFGKILQTNIGQLLGLTLGILLVDTLGRVGVQQLGYSVSALFTIGLGFPTLGEEKLALFATVALSAQMMCSCCTWTHTPELFPTRVRVLATGLCSSFARLGAGSSPYVISDWIPPLPTALILAAASCMAATAVSCVKETKSVKMDDDDICTSDGSEAEGSEELSEYEDGS